MRRLAVVALALATVMLVQVMSGQSKPASPAPDALVFGPPDGWPDQHPVPDTTQDDGPDGPERLPSASLTEPFAIGEALHDPSRVDVAVVSLLGLMGIEIVPDDPNAPVVIGAARVRFAESEVRALIEIGIRDAEAQGQDPDGPVTLKDLHTTLAPALPGVSAEGLAELYRRAYEQQPEGLVPRVLLGQPLEPDTPLLRTELWLLHADGVLRPDAGRRAARRGPRLVFAAATNTQGGGSSGYFGPSGALQRVLQPPSGSTLSGVEWAELQWRLPMVVASSVTLTQGVAIHERHGGSGSAATIQARFRLRPIQLTSTGTTINPAPLAAAGLPVTWEPDPTVLSHASPASPVSTTVGFDGVARLSLAPNPEAAQGRGVIVSDNGRTFIRFDYGAFVGRYGLNAPTPGNYLLSVSTGVGLQWHVEEGIEFRLSNNFDVGSLGVTRSGWDYGTGHLVLGDDGIYRGQGRLIAHTTRMALPGKSCTPLNRRASQPVDVVGVPLVRDVVPNNPAQASFYTEVHKPAFYRWSRGQPATYLRLEFTPRRASRYVPPCQDGIPGPAGAPDFVPVNDAQWTITGYGSAGGVATANRAGYAIAVPEDGLLRYEDRTSENASMTTSPQFRVGQSRRTAESPVDLVRDCHPDQG